MNFYIPIFFSFLITVIAIPQTIKLAKKYNLIDNPLTRPHPANTQKRIVPRAGGLAIFCAIFLTIILFIPLQQQILGILGGMIILVTIGILDDKYKNLSPYFRLLGQFVAALIVIISGIGINFVTNPMGGILHLNTINFLPQILTLIWIVWVMNMINWSKGVDGQMPGIVVVAAIILGILSLKLSLSQDSSQSIVANLSFITASSSIGLLLFNWYPAKIFPGFSGSTILGFMIAVLAILSGAKLATALLVLLIPATDFAYTFIRRILQGKSPVWGDRGHLHHKLLEAGFSHPQISLFYILGSVILGATALLLPSQGKIFAASLVGLLILGTILWLNFFGALSKQSDPDNG